MDIHTRRLRHFLTLVEHLHFGRAAAHLHLTQQALSRDLQILERDLGFRLIDRTTRRVTLTRAGESFALTAKDVLELLEDGRRSALELDERARHTLRLGFVVGGALELTDLILEEFARRRPDVDVELREFGSEDPTAGLAQNGSEVAFIRLPIDVREVSLIPLFSEPVWVALPHQHQLVTYDRISITDLGDETVIVRGGYDPTSDQFWSGGTSLDGAGDVVRKKLTIARSITEELSMVAAGRGCSLVTLSVVRLLPHPHVRFVPVEDVPRSTVALGIRRDCEDLPAVAALRDVVRSICEREAGLIQLIEGRG